MRYPSMLAWSYYHTRQSAPIAPAPPNEPPDLAEFEVRDRFTLNGKVAIIKAITYTIQVGTRIIEGVPESDLLQAIRGDIQELVGRPQLFIDNPAKHLSEAINRNGYGTRSRAGQAVGS